MIPVVLGLTAWIAKGVALTALPRLLKAVTACCSPTPKAGPIPSLPRNQAVLQAPDRVIIFNYDNLSQLIGVNINNTPAATFGFDAAGNLQTLTVGNTTTGMTYNALNQRVTPGTNVYDPKGQTTDKDGRTFEWDDDGRMTAIVDGTHRSEMAYDGYGRRIKIAEFDNGVITSKKLYWWLGGEIVTEREGLTAGFPLTKQYFSQGVIANGVKLFYTFDQLGSVRELIDSTGAVRADYRYDTYGKRTKESGDLDSDFGYAGLFHHGPSGLDLATYRTYDSAQGRWISRDPLGEGVDYNLYRYANNNPISGADPLGLDPSSTLSTTLTPNNGLDGTNLIIQSELLTAPGSTEEVSVDIRLTATGIGPNGAGRVPVQQWIHPLLGDDAPSMSELNLVNHDMMPGYGIRRRKTALTILPEDLRGYEELIIRGDITVWSFSCGKWKRVLSREFIYQVYKVTKFGRLVLPPIFSYPNGTNGGSKN